VGADDRQKLDEYLSSIRDVEKRIQKHRAQQQREGAGGRARRSIPTDFAEHSHLIAGSDDSGVSKPTPRA